VLSLNFKYNTRDTNRNALPNSDLMGNCIALNYIRLKRAFSHRKTQPIEKLNIKKLVEGVKRAQPV
jgi:hypothetical protein